MFNISKRILVNNHDVEDVLIVSFTKVFDNIHRFEYRGEDSLDKWIKTIVINESIRLLNKGNQVIYNESMAEYEKYMDENQIEFDTVDTEQIYSIIENMPAGYRLVFNLFAVEGYTHKEISELLNISENTSKSQLRKARLYIIEKLDKTQNYGYAEN